MKNDIIPPRPSSASADQMPQPVNNPDQTSSPKPFNVTPEALAAPQTVTEQPDEGGETPKRSKKPLLCIIGTLLAFVVLMAIGLFAWYQLALRPVASGDVANIRVTIVEGSSPSQIGQLLEEKNVIRDQNAFDVYTRLNNIRGKLQAGDFSLSPAESTPQIVGHLTSGQTEQYSVTFYPGATLNIASTSADKTPSHRQVLEDAGFTSAEIDEAFAANYDHPLFADKPASADLEGYIYGETYQVAMGASAKQILTRTFDEYYAQIEKNNLLAGFEKQGLNLYEAITLASIVQREVPTKADQKQVAQVFFTRLEMGMMLGSDVTYHYAADKRGVPRDHRLEDPYNTRINTGLPPGPIASPGITSLQAVAAPADGDFVYFLSGDDGKTYFARTNEQHEQNIIDHCSFKCSLP